MIIRIGICTCTSSGSPTIPRFHGFLRVTPAFLNFGREPLPYRSLHKVVEVKQQRSVPEPSEWLERMKRLTHLRDLITRNLDRAYETQAKYYDKLRRERHFQVGDLVLKCERVLSNKKKDIAAKLSNKFSGPYKVVRRLSPVVFRLVDSRGNYAGKEHVRHLKLYVASSDQSEGKYSGKLFWCKSRNCPKETLRIRIAA